MNITKKKMHTIQCRFPGKSWKMLKKSAIDQGISIAEMVRRIVAKDQAG